MNSNRFLSLNIIVARNNILDLYAQGYITHKKYTIQGKSLIPN